MLMVVRLAALLVGENPTLWVGGIVLAGVLLALIVRSGMSSVERQYVLNTPLPLLLADTLINYAIARAVKIVAQEATRYNEQRVRVAEANAAIGQRILSSRLDLAILVKETVTLVRDSFADATHVQLYLTDNERRNAIL